MTKILIFGLPGSGKTTLARNLNKISSNAFVHFNADEIRKEINRDLGFSMDDRLEQARRMGVLCNIVNRAKVPAIADFVCPTPDTRTIFGASKTIFMNTIPEGRFADTNSLFVPLNGDPAKHETGMVINNFDYEIFNILEWIHQ